MNEKRYFEDFVVGEETVSSSRTVTETDIVNFAGISGDFHPLHMDAEYAAQTLFGGRIAHGLLGLTLASGLRPRVPQPEMALIAFLGLVWRFRSPVRIGDTIHVRRTVKEKRESKEPGRGIVTAVVRVVNQKGETVQEGEFTSLVARRPA